MSFRVKTIVGVALIEAVLLIFLVWTSLNILRESNQRELINRARTVATLSATMVKDAVVATDLATLEVFVADILLNRGITYIRVMQDDGTILAEANSRDLATRAFSPDERLEDASDGIFDTFAPIVESDVIFGRVEVGLATEELQSVFISARDHALAIAGLEIAMVGLFSFLLGSYLTRQLSGLTQAAEQISQGNLDTRISVKGRDELAQTADAFNRMSRRISELYSNLQAEISRKAAVMDCAIDCIITIDHEGKILEFNPAAEATFGYRREEIIGKYLADHLVPAALREAHRRGLEQYLRTGHGPVIGQRIEVPALRADQIEFPVELAITAVRTEETVFFTAYLRDLTELKAAENERRRLTMALHASIDGILVHDAKGIIRYANPAFSKITGWSNEELLGRTPGKLLESGLMPEDFFKKMQSTLARNEIWAGRILNRRKPAAGQTRGELLWVHTTIAPITERSGELLGYVEVQRDITDEIAYEEHQRYERESAEIRAKVSQLLQTRLPLTNRLESVLQCLVEMRDLAENDRACILLDRQTSVIPEGLITHPDCRWRDHLQPRHLTYMYSTLAAQRPLREMVIVSETSAFLSDRQARRSHGHYGVPIHYGESAFGLLLLVTESAPIENPDRLTMLRMIGEMLGMAITNHRAQREMELARETAEKAARIKSEFLANMSHEIRTPMYGVLGMLDLLAEAPLNAQYQEYLKIAHKSGQILLNVINDILDFSRIEAGELNLEEIDFNISKTVENVITLLADRARRKGIELLCLISDRVPEMARGDPGRLSQVLMNLVGNAVKFTEQGEVTVRIDAAEGESAVALSCEVQDTGIGIPEAIQPGLFRPFTQADGSIRRRYGGSGLGLVISKQLIERMGGHIEFSSIPGTGSLFRFQIRLTHPEREPRLPYSVAGKRILVVDDNPNNRNILSSYLNGWQIDYDTAADAAEALVKLRAAAAAGQPWQAAIVDRQMPDTDGIELARAIRDDPRLADIRLLLLSSLGEVIDDMAARGIDMHLHKPIRKSQLHAALTALVGQPLPALQQTESGKASVSFSLQGNVLLVEDDEIGRQVSLAMLKNLGLSVKLAGNGREAIAATAATAFDVILMDCQTPDIDGLEATRAIREREKLSDSGRAPIIALTANAMQGDREACFEAGMDEYLTKPLLSDTLATTLKRWLTVLPAASHGAFGQGSIRVGRAAEHARNAAAGIHIDMDRFGQIRDLMGPRLPALVETFESLGQSLALDLRSAAREGDLERLASAAHRLTGLCGNLGAAQLLGLCRQLEENSRGGDATQAPEQVERIAALHVETCEELHRLLAQ